MKPWKTILFSTLLSVLVGVASAGFTAQLVTESRLSKLEATVNAIYDDVSLLKTHILGD